MLKFGIAALLYRPPLSLSRLYFSYLVLLLSKANRSFPVCLFRLPLGTNHKQNRDVE